MYPFLQPYPFLFSDNLTRKRYPDWQSLRPSRSTEKKITLGSKFVGSFCFLGGSAVQQSDESESMLNFARSSANRNRTIESMIVVEKMMTKFYGVDQIKKYVPTIVNMVK